jgi:hypothetical protein
VSFDKNDWKRVQPEVLSTAYRSLGVSFIQLDVITSNHFFAGAGHIHR